MLYLAQVCVSVCPNDRPNLKTLVAMLSAWQLRRHTGEKSETSSYVEVINKGQGHFCVHSSRGIWLSIIITTTTTMITRRALSRAHLLPTKVFRRLKSTRRCCDGRPMHSGGQQNHFKTTAAAANAPSSANAIAEKAIRFRHPDYDPDLAQKLISSSMSRHLSTRNISSKSMHGFLSNLANRQTDRQTSRAIAYTSSFVGGT